MKLWRLTRRDRVAFDGKGAEIHGGRYASPGTPLVSFASEAGLAVLVALRYWVAADSADYVLGWTESHAPAERAPIGAEDAAIKAHVDAWAAARRSLLIAVRSAVLPEADIILMNAAHPDAASLAPLTTRPFSFAECLHRPPMLDRFRNQS